MWRDFACVKVLLLVRFIFSALYFPQCPSSAVCAFVRGVCVRERERERDRDRVFLAETSIFVHLHTGSILRSFDAVSQVKDNSLNIH